MLYCNSPLVYHDYLGAGQDAIKDGLDGAIYKRKLTMEEKEALKSVLGSKLYPYGLKLCDIDKCDIYFFDELSKYRLYCFYTIYTDSDGNLLEKIDEKIREFGDSFSVVNIHEYIKKVKEFLPEEISFTPTSIKYVDFETYNGALDITCKDFNKYRYQNEYRFIFYSESFKDDSPYTINLENLEDQASEIFDIDKLFSIKNIKELGIEV